MEQRNGEDERRIVGVEHLLYLRHPVRQQEFLGVENASEEVLAEKIVPLREGGEKVDLKEMHPKGTEEGNRPYLHGIARTSIQKARVR